jgi:hemoglobin-like flavoprotein
MHRVALLLLIGAVSLTVAKIPIEHCCSHGDRSVVQKQWQDVFFHQDAKFRAGVVRLLLLRVIQDHPEAHDLFTAVDVDNPTGGPFTAHAMRIFNAIDMTINLLDDPNALEEALDHLAYQHHGRPGVKREHFTSFGQAMHRGLPKIIDSYNYLSWKACFGEILRKIAGRLTA